MRGHTKKIHSHANRIFGYKRILTTKRTVTVRPLPPQLPSHVRKIEKNHSTQKNTTTLMKEVGTDTRQFSCF
jgi:hypothetical protein